MRLTRSAVFFAAFLLSFAIYKIPLFQLEAGWLPLGKTLLAVREITAPSLAWFLSALVLQAIAFITAFFFLRTFSWKKGMLLVASTPIFILVANVILLWLIPIYFLVERDMASEVGNLEKVCSIPDASIAQVNSGANLSLVHAGEALLVTRAGRNRTLLKMPACQLIALDGQFDGSNIDAVAPGGHILHRQMNGAIAYLNPDLNEIERQPQPDGDSYWKPIITDDGRALAWLDRVQSEGIRGANRIHLRNLATGEERLLQVALSGLDQVELLGARSIDGPFTIAKFRNAIFEFDREGEVLRGPVSPEGIYDARWGFVWLNGGWIAWDGYREDGRSRIVWNIPNGRGERSIPRGRSIDALTVAADGDLIAVSVSSNLRVGGIQSAVFAFRTGTGQEIYRRQYPGRQRSGVAFLGDEYLAVDERQANQWSVGVYRIPKPDENP